MPCEAQPVTRRRAPACCAAELAKALKTDVNSLPLSLDISWFEQKAV
jgi:hydroxylamine reductase (hybrid-cluster protein)